MLTCTHDSREGVEPTVLTPGRDCVDTETKEGGCASGSLVATWDKGALRFLFSS